MPESRWRAHRRQVAHHSAQTRQADLATGGLRPAVQRAHPAALQAIAAGLPGQLGVAGGVHPFGDPGEVPMDQYYLEKAQPEKAANNVVTAIVFDYRGFDTLGEGAVLFTAICSVAALFRQGGHGK